MNSSAAQVLSAAVPCSSLGSLRLGRTAQSIVVRLTRFLSFICLTYSDLTSSHIFKRLKDAIGFLSEKFLTEKEGSSMVGLFAKPLFEAMAEHNKIVWVEQSAYALLRTRDMAVSRYKEFGIPVDWLSDSGVVGKIKLSSVLLSRKYMKRVADELDSVNGADKDPNREFLLLQGVRFAFRVHQFAGGFDAESMKSFEELRSRAKTESGGDNSNNNEESIN